MTSADTPGYDRHMTHFLQQALVFLGASVILVPLFHRLGLGSVLGYLGAGVLVGPHALGLIPEAESILHFSELGVVLLLFIIGLEIQPRKLWGMRLRLGGLGGGQVLLCSLAFAFSAWALGASPLAAGVLGFALSLSSTAFALQTLAEKNLLNTPMGQSSFAVLLAQDLLAIPALALIPALASRGASSGNGWQGLGLFILLLLGLVLTSRFLFRPAFRAIAATRSREMFTAATLLVVMGVAALMLGVGLSAALGAFIGGVLLADSEYRHELEADLGPFKGLLMGLFFISVGMTVDLGLVRARPLDVAGLTLGYMLVKGLLVYGIGRLGRMGHQSALQMTLTIGQGGEFAFVIFGLAGGMSLVDGATLAILTAVVTLSMALSPLFAAVHSRWFSCAGLGVIPAYDKIEGEDPQVIIAGFGRFGQVFARVLRAQGIPFVAIDHDGEQIELVRKFGNKVYFGDASRLDILEAAGATRAKYFILAIDDVELSLKTARHLREHFPHLVVYARARNRNHAFELMELGVTRIKRETFDSSANFTGELLMEMGFAPERAQAVMERFRAHDQLMLEAQFQARNDDEEFVSVSLKGQAQLEQVLLEDDTRSYIRPA